MLNSAIKPPVPKKEKHETEIHGHILQDDYFWLRQKENQEVIDYLNSENEYTAQVLKATEDFQKKLYDEMLAKIKETDLSVPVKRDDYFYYSRTEQGKQYGIYCRKHRSLENEEQILLDLNELAEGFEYFSLGAAAVSPNHRFLAYSTDVSGVEVYELHVKDLQTGQVLEDVIKDTATSLDWGMDDQTIFYTTQDEMQRPYKLFRHLLGTDPKKDALVYHEKDDGFFLSCYKSKDRKYLFVDTSSKTTSEVYYLDAHRPASELKLIHAREENHEYSVDHHKDLFFIVTNDRAQNFKLVEVAASAPQKENWREVIEHRSDVKIEDIELFNDYLIVFERQKGLNQIRVHHFESQETYYIEFDEEVYTLWEDNNPELKTNILRFGYASLVTPNSVFDFNLQTRERELKKQQEVLGGYNPAQYDSRRVFAKSHDGVDVPISLVYRKGIKLDGQNPFLLYGYGSYGLTVEPNFSSNRLSLLDRGFVFAIAHIRGGGSLGRPWYDDGKMKKKHNTFFDFIACAELMINEKYTSPQKLVISGGSAGGLLMGAVVNQRPELFQGVLMHVPFVDVMNTMLDTTLPLTVTEFDEWGNPAEKEAFDVIIQYSPYNNIRKQNYPHMLVTGGLNDPRVQYWEPAKWVARVRENKTDNHVVLLKINMGAGHGGASGRYDFLKEIALDYAFLCAILEITE